MAGMKEIIIEHPLRHMYYWNDEAKQRLADTDFYESWEPPTKEQFILTMDKYLGVVVFKSYNDAISSLRYYLRKANLQVNPDQEEIILNSMILTGWGQGYISENSDGSLISDPALREVHTIPEDMDIQEYMEREVFPNDELAWVIDQ